MNGVSGRVAWSFVFAGAMLTTVLVSRYLTFSPDAFFSEQREVYESHRLGLYGHILGSMLAMFIGPFQFLAGLRDRAPAVHRWLGRLYLGGCLIGGVCGLWMAQFAYGGTLAGAGFAALAVCWLGCGGMALHRILVRNVLAHREWMIRSFALTLAAFSLRMQLLTHGILVSSDAIDLSFVTAYTAIAWSCWMPNLILAEIYVRRSRTAPRPVLESHGTTAPVATR